MSPRLTKTLFAPLQKTSRFHAWFKENIVRINAMCFALIVILCGCYIWQVNSAVAKGYVMKDYETQIEDLALTNQQMEVAVRQAESLENVTRATKMLGFVKSERPTYIDPADASVVFAD
jgi:hypothetical protein